MNMKDYINFYIYIKVKEQLAVRKDMDVNEHDRLSNITLKTQMYRNSL